MVYAEIVRESRKLRDWSREQLAAEAGCSVRTVSNVEAGHVVTVKTLQRIADALGLSARERALCLGAES